MDLEARRVMFATPGRDADTVKAFADDLAAHGGEPKTQVQEVCCDMSPAFISGIGSYLAEQPEEAGTVAEGGAPIATQADVAAVQCDDGSGEPGAEPTNLHSPAEIIFDRYHVVAKANEAVDEVQRAESKGRPELKRTRYVWLKNETNLTEKQREKLAWLTRPSMQLKTARAARWRDDFNEFYNKTTTEEAEDYLRRWCYGAKRSRLDPIKEFVSTVEAHWDGILAWQKHRLSNECASHCASL